MYVVSLFLFLLLISSICYYQTFALLKKSHKVTSVFEFLLLV